MISVALKERSGVKSSAKNGVHFRFSVLLLERWVGSGGSDWKSKQEESGFEQIKSDCPTLPVITVSKVQ